MSDFTMPSLGADMDEGTLLEWLVEPGDTVHKGDIVAVVDTSKAAVEVESFSDGVVENLVVQPGTTVPVGAVLATLTAPGAAPVAAPAPAPAAAAPRAEPTPSRAPRRAARASAAPARRPRAPPGPDAGRAAGQLPAGAPRGRTPGRRPRRGHRHRPRRGDHPRRRGPGRRAGSHRTGSGPAGPRGAGGPGNARGARHAVRPLAGPGARRRPGHADGARTGVRSGPPTSAPPPPRPPRRRRHRPSPPRPSRPPPRRRAAPAHADRREEMRRTIATVMARSKREIPHYYLTLTIDLDRALSWMRERNRGLPVTERLVPAALLLKATARAAADAPALNGFWVDDEFRPGPGVHLGIAVSLRGGGLVAPALHDADRLTVEEVMAGMRDIVSRTRAGRLRALRAERPHDHRHQPRASRGSSRCTG